MIKHLPSVTNQGSAERQGYRGDVGFLVAHLDAAHNLARWLMRNQTEAEDVVQDAFLRAISHFAGFRGGDGRAWLLTIVRHTCYDRLKQKATSRQNTGFDEALHSADRQLPDPGAWRAAHHGRGRDPRGRRSGRPAPGVERPRQRL